MAEQANFYCLRCQQPRLFTRNGTNHVLHLLLTLFLCGTWLIIWIIVALSNSSNPYYCTFCGYSGSPSALANPHRTRQRLEAQRIRDAQPSFVEATALPFVREQYKKNPAAVIVAAIAAPLVLIILVALLSEAARSPKQNVATVYNPPKTIETPKDVKPPNLAKLKSAVVIMEYADIFEEKSVNSNVVKNAPKDATVFVIKQSGAWLYVEYLGVKGWTHGNNIKYIN